jgi:hypothetical protein
MTKEEALALALEALEDSTRVVTTMMGNSLMYEPSMFERQAVCKYVRGWFRSHKVAQTEKAIAAIKQALAAPVQQSRSDVEPVAWMYEDMMGLVGVRVQKEKPIVARPVTPLYTTPPYVATPLAAQRQWVEVEQIKWEGDKLIAKLKEKNCD